MRLNTSAVQELTAVESNSPSKESQTSLSPLHLLYSYRATAVGLRAPLPYRCIHALAMRPPAQPLSPCHVDTATYTSYCEPDGYSVRSPLHRCRGAPLSESRIHKRKCAPSRYGYMERKRKKHASSAGPVGRIACENRGAPLQSNARARACRGGVWKRGHRCMLATDQRVHAERPRRGPLEPSPLESRHLLL